MKANCYKDDLAEVVSTNNVSFLPSLNHIPQEDPMKPLLEAMINNITASLSGTDRAFYDREFTFFNEITSISGKLKPYIKKTKPEKKVTVEIRNPQSRLLCSF